MGRRRDDPALQAAKGFPGRRKTKTERALAEAERLAKLLADAPADVAGIPQMLADPRLAAAQQVWKDYAPQLAKNNLLEKTDRLMFAMFCVYMADFAIANEDILVKGYSVMVKTVSGDKMPRENPSVSRRDVAAKFVMELSSRFGLSPLDRYDLMKRQAGNPLGGLFAPGVGTPSQEPATPTPAPPAAEEDIVGALAGFDSPPPGTQVN